MTGSGRADGQVDPLGYWTEVAKAAARELRRAPRPFARDLLSVGLARQQAATAPERWVLDVFPELRDRPVEMGTVTYTQSGMGPYEQYVLRGVAHLRRPRRIFEIGTFEGATTLILAEAAPSAEIYTLDLPRGASPAHAVAHEVEAVADDAIGARFVGSEAASRITQLRGDSTTFDFSPWFGSCDLVLVDGGHDYETVKSDTANALRLLSESATLLWDDYTAGWPGVVRAVDELGDTRIVHLANTALAVLVVP